MDVFCLLFPLTRLSSSLHAIQSVVDLQGYNSCQICGTDCGGGDCMTCPHDCPVSSYYVAHVHCAASTVFIA